MLGLMEHIGPSHEDGYPLPELGGIYQVQCKRWREGKDQWDLQDPDVAMKWVIKPEPLGVAGELFIQAIREFSNHAPRGRGIQSRRQPILSEPR
jgi:hypothetical protein